LASDWGLNPHKANSARAAAEPRKPISGRVRMARREKVFTEATPSARGGVSSAMKVGMDVFIVEGQGYGWGSGEWGEELGG